MYDKYDKQKSKSLLQFTVRILPNYVHTSLPSHSGIALLLSHTGSEDIQ